MKNFRKLADLEVTNKIVLLRVDLNVPIMHGKITDLTRIKRVAPTIEYLTERGAKVVLLSHYGRPDGKFNLGMSLSPITDAISAILDDKDIKFSVDIMASSIRSDIAKLAPGEVLLVENLRFHKGEETNDIEFAKHIASLGDVYVNDAFSCSHRAHASISMVAGLLPSAAGLLMQEELENLKKYLEAPTAPVVAIVGGAKVSTKIDLLRSLVNKVDSIFIAGAMANTFLHVQGYNIGKSVFEKEYLDTAANILQQAESHNCNIILPIDVVTTIELSDNSKCRVSKVDKVRDDDMIFDIGPKSLMNLITVLEASKTVVWNGPLGAFEHKPFDIGTVTIAQAISEMTSEGKLISIVGGGDVVSAVTNAGLGDNFTYSSTGGGAFLEWIEGKILPGIEVLCQK